MRLGIFLAYSPNQLDPFQGISRLIGFVIHGAIDLDETEVTIACPEWLRNDVLELLKESGISTEAIEILTTRSEPYLIRFWRYAADRRSVRRRRSRPLEVISDAVRRVIGDAILYWLGSSSNILFVFGLIVCVVAAVVAFPSVAIIGLIFGMLSLAYRGFNRIFGSYFSTVNQILSRVKSYLSSPQSVEKMRGRELDRLIASINRRRDISVWYVPSMFWPETSAIRAPVVMAAPDIVLLEHPSQFPGATVGAIYKKIIRSVKGADHLICYSEHVKQLHIVKHIGIDAQRVSVIGHASIDLSKEVARSSGNGATPRAVTLMSLERTPGKAPRAMRHDHKAEALDIVHSYVKRRKDSLPPYLQGFRFDDVPFIFYSSQDRPHKNIEGLVRAYERVLRREYRPVKLILTAKIRDNPRILQFIRSRGLEADILSLHSVPNTVLAALYRLARLSVNPTQFEGGFPFTFSEAYSVGTPSILSRIPVVREQITDPTLLRLVTFDPVDQDEMVRKMVWGLDHREELFAAQRPIYEALSRRTWKSVAGEYLDVLAEVGTRSRRVAPETSKSLSADV